LLSRASTCRLTLTYSLSTIRHKLCISFASRYVHWYNRLLPFAIDSRRQSFSIPPACILHVLISTNSRDCCVSCNMVFDSWNIS
jgi:hypothetical protein